MTSKIAGIYTCLKIGALICCLATCSMASGHYYAVQSASTEDTIVTNENDALLNVRLQGIEPVAGLAFDISKASNLNIEIPDIKPEAQTVVMISAASKVVKESEETEPETDVQQESEVQSETEAQTEVLAEPAVSEKYANLAVTTVTEDWLNIRSDASSDAEIVGKLYPGAAGQIVEENGDWTKITSGTVTGWVNNQFLVKRIDAQNSESVYGKPSALVNAEGLRVRASASTESKVLGSVDAGKTYGVLSIAEGWLEISFEGNSGFISSEFASVDYNYGNAISIEEERAAIAEQERIEAERRAAEEAKKMTVTTTRGAAIALSEEDIILMGAVVQIEAGGSSYDNKLAVANVILNRLKSGKWGSSISSVIYAKGQFSGSANGRIDSIAASGPKKSCIQAVRDAVAGSNNVGNIMFFCSTRIMNTDSYSSYMVIGDNCFYVR